MSLVISDEILRAAKMTEAEMLQEIVLMLFQQEKISLGKASHLLGIHQLDFQNLLASRNLSVHYDVEDFRQDVANLKQHGWR